MKNKIYFFIILSCIPLSNQINLQKLKKRKHNNICKGEDADYQDFIVEKETGIIKNKDFIGVPDYEEIVYNNIETYILEAIEYKKESKIRLLIRSGWSIDFKECTYKNKKYSLFINKKENNHELLLHSYYFDDYSIIESDKGNDNDNDFILIYNNHDNFFPGYIYKDYHIQREDYFNSKIKGSSDLYFSFEINDKKADELKRFFTKSSSHYDEDFDYGYYIDKFNIELRQYFRYKLNNEILEFYVTTNGHRIMNFLMESSEREEQVLNYLYKYRNKEDKLYDCMYSVHILINFFKKINKDFERMFKDKLISPSTSTEEYKKNEVQSNYIVSSRLYRGTNFEINVEDGKHKNKIFMSASTDIKVAAGFAYNFIYEIIGNDNCEVSVLCVYCKGLFPNYDNEKEVIIKPNTVFRIVGLERMEIIEYKKNNTAYVKEFKITTLEPICA